MTGALEYTGERMVPEGADPATFLEHVHRYRFATRFAVGKDVIDVACGEGYGTAALAAAGARSVVGIDLSADSVAHAKRKYGVDARVGDASSLPLKDASADLVVSFETIEHVAEAERFVDEAARVCRPGGEFLISTPYPPVFDRRGHNHFHVREMMPEEFRRVLSARFAVQRCFVQRIDAVRWWSPRILCADAGLWFRVPGIHRLVRHVRSSICAELAEVTGVGGRDDVVRTILRSETWAARCFNPYAVRREIPWLGDQPTYLLASCKRRGS